jgi:uncharacterized protein YndB with AHSA1/START domain
VVEAREREMIRHSVEINRRPEDVFAYLDQLDRYVEWQDSLISTRVDTEGPTRVGSRGVDTRRAPGGPRDIPFEVTEHDPPRKISFRGTAGPVRPVATVTVEPVGDGSGSRVSLELDLQGHGFGKLVAPFARRQAAREVPQDHGRLKERLEAGG